MNRFYSLDWRLSDRLPLLVYRDCPIQIIKYNECLLSYQTEIASLILVLNPYKLLLCTNTLLNENPPKKLRMFRLPTLMFQNCPFTFTSPFFFSRI